MLLLGLVVLLHQSGCGGQIGPSAKGEGSSSDPTTGSSSDPTGSSGNPSTGSSSPDDAPVTGETWELDGQVVATHASASGYFSYESGRLFVLIPARSSSQPDRVGLDLGGWKPVVGQVSCGGGDSIDTHYAADDGLSLPPEWLNLTFYCLPPGLDATDRMSASVIVDESDVIAVGQGRVRAHYDFSVVGTGPRAGHVLRVHGSATLTAWGAGP